VLYPLKRCHQLGLEIEAGKTEAVTRDESKYRWYYEDAGMIDVTSVNGGSITGH